MKTTLREAWPESARVRSITARQQQARLRKVRFYLNTSTPGLTAGDFSSRAGFKGNPETVAEAELAEVLKAIEQNDKLEEKWSDAARMAAVAARRARGKGKDWRKAARQMYYKQKQGHVFTTGKGEAAFGRSVSKWTARANTYDQGGISGSTMTGRTMGKFLRRERAKYDRKAGVFFRPNG